MVTLIDQHSLVFQFCNHRINKFLIIIWESHYLGFKSDYLIGVSYYRVSHIVLLSWVSTAARYLGELFIANNFSDRTLAIFVSVIIDWESRMNN